MTRPLYAHCLTCGTFVRAAGRGPWFCGFCEP